MKRILIEQAKKQVGEQVKLAGWVYIKRDQGNIKFLVLRDVSGTMQGVVVKKSTPEVAKIAGSINLESVVNVIGTIQEEKQAPGGFEILIEEIEVLSEAAEQLPIPTIEKKVFTEADQPSRMDWRWIDLRRPEKLLIFKAWTTMEQAMINHWVENGFTRIHSPKLMSAPSESGAELFSVPYFDQTAYLAQSPQFYKQMAMASGFEKVFEIGPVFRANKSFTTRHDTEFTGYDMEISFIESHEDVMATEEQWLIAGIKAVQEKHGDEIEELFGRKLVVPTAPFPRVTMKEAKEMLAKKDIESKEDGDLSPEEERELCKLIAEKYGHEFVFITEYPIDVRPFYHMRFEDRPELTKSFDLLWNGIEITTGAQREHRYEVLKKQALEKGLTEKSLENYLNFFKYGCPPHGGMGLSPSRLLMKIFNVENVREVTYIYRGVKRLTP